MDEYIEYVLIVLFYTYFIVIVVLEVTLRYVFNSSTIIGEETARHAFIWLAWIAASLAAKKRIHISIAVFETKFSPRVQYVTSYIYNALFILLCFYGIRYVYPIIESQVEYGTLTRAAQYPMYLIYLSIPIGYTLMILRVIQNMVIDTIDWRAGRPVRKGAALF